MKIPVVWKSYNPDSPSYGYWDQGLLADLLTNRLWDPVGGFDFIQLEDFNDVIEYNDGAILVIPARSNGQYIDQINGDIATLKWVIVMLTGDEENTFPRDRLQHDNMLVYVMSPREDLDLTKSRVLGTGYPGHIHKHLDDGEVPNKLLDFFFSGQITHGRRQEMKDNLEMVSDEDNDLLGWRMYTEGFTQGIDHELYYDKMARAKTAPAPSGPETPDTFRLFEALEAGCVPIADTRVTKGGFSDKYWTFFFGEEPPFPIITDYSDMKGYIEDQVRQYPVQNNRVFAWWQNKKRELSYQLVDDITALSKLKSPDYRVKDSVTVIVPVSPIKSHPETYILEETLKSIRHHLLDAEIIVTFDGVRPENESRRKDYEEFIRRMLWKFNYEYPNIVPIIFEEHMHQTGMARAIMDCIQTPLLLYVEQDTPIVTDETIDWAVCIENIMLPGKADVIRFHHEGVIPKEHNHMIHGLLPDSTMFMRTSQWSQRPHLASVAFYRRILQTCFSEDSKSFIEDKMHGVCAEAYNIDGLMGWNNYKLVIYYPEGNIKRSYHTDGRAGEQKWDDTQIF